MNKTCKYFPTFCYIGAAVCTGYKTRTNAVEPCENIENCTRKLWADEPEILKYKLSEIEKLKTSNGENLNGTK